MELVAGPRRPRVVACELFTFSDEMTEEILSRLDAQSVSGVLFDLLGIYSLRSGRDLRQIWSQMYPNVEDDPPEPDVKFITMMGHHNGVICLSCLNQNTAFLWNPSIRKLKKLPPLDLPYPTHGGGAPPRSSYWYGLAYVDDADDFKVVGLSGCEEQRCGQFYYGANFFRRGNRVGVYSLMRNSWKTTLEMPDIFSEHDHDDDHDPESSTLIVTQPHRVFSSSLVVNGSIHWLIHYGRRQVKGLLESVGIVAFDVTTEVFNLITSPPSLKLRKGCRFHGMSQWYGCLSLVNFETPVSVEIWVMDNYGVSASWTKRFSLDLLECCPVTDAPVVFWPHALCDNGNLLFVYSGDFYLYDVKNNRVECVAPRGHSIIRQATTYVESMFLS
ncbi:F-box associated domain [Trema orientale]|uniref:F-box associated domain n=1 Tax=Trema orientale TaxID=63057 RepID=A0A2P5FD93_TREOI|nr:F-box associated domain [Trema orientale]